MTVGENIKRFRKKQGLTQKQLGELCGMNESQLRRYEIGKANPKIETIQKIAEAMSVPINHLLEGNWSQYLSDRWPEGRELKGLYNQLNESGQKEAVKRVTELTRLPEYRNDVK